MEEGFDEVAVARLERRLDAYDGDVGVRGPVDDLPAGRAVASMPWR